MSIGSLKLYAQEVFREVNKRSSKNKFETFLKEFNKLVEESKTTNNDVGCAISNDCSVSGCYRYYMCDFENKKI